MKPSYYQAKPFHGVRTVSALSSIIVASILVYFCIQLKSDNFKIPWTFLIVSHAEGSTTSSDMIVGTSSVCSHNHIARSHVMHPFMLEIKSDRQSDPQYPTCTGMDCWYGTHGLEFVRNTCTRLYD